jgi:hypothetical protein
MKDFKFFQKGTVDMIDGETYATASFNDDTPEGHMGRRRLYHTDCDLYDRLRGLNDNPIRLFKTTSVTTVNPKWWMKIKMFFQKINFQIQFNSEIVGTIVIAGSLTIGFILIIAKLLNAF